MHHDVAFCFIIRCRCYGNAKLIATPIIIGTRPAIGKLAVEGVVVFNTVLSRCVVVTPGTETGGPEFPPAAGAVVSGSPPACVVVSTAATVGIVDAFTAVTKTAVNIVC